jgi:alkylated DNA nucleotide flippase Atl1
MARGRPTGQMTHRRRQVLRCLIMAKAEGQRVTYAEIARRCGLCDYREARRVVADMRKIARGSSLSAFSAVGAVGDGKAGRPRSTGLETENRAICPA